ncbi:MAG: hypothetical protein EXR71_20925 [Myxococcales bacterium]|nr:hypothetical protein [Myxococcales bacterium]
MAAIVPVCGVGPAPVGGPAEGVMVALKLARPDDPLSVEALRREVLVFEALCRLPGEVACPRLYDVVESPVPGLIMEWCPIDMERWWAQQPFNPQTAAALFEAMAAVCRRVREYAVVSELELGQRVVHADIKPRNILLSATGRWLLTDFGAAKSRSIDEESWLATRMVIGTENYIAPETLFNSTKTVPAAMDTWSIGCTLFALLRMRSLLRGGGRLPPNGTHAHHFRSHRTALVADLQLRQPNRFAGRALDATAFVSHDRLPDKDRAAVVDALDGLFQNGNLEARLCADVVNLLDRALLIEPTRRYLDPIEMAGDFEALATRVRELAVRADGGPTSPRTSMPAVPPPQEPTVVTPPAPATASSPSGSMRWVLGGGALLAGLFGVLSLAALAVGAWQWTHQTPRGVESVESVESVAVVPTPKVAEPAVVTPGPSSVTPGPSRAAPGPSSAAPGPSSAAPRARRRAPPPGEQDAVVAPGGTGSLVVVGADAYVVGPRGRRAVGELPPGKYQLFTSVDGTYASQGQTRVYAGETTTWRCGFGKCREDDAE